MPVTVRYRFSQSFAVSAIEAFLWCTDFSPIDHQLMGHATAERQVMRVSNDVMVLKDVFHTADGVVEKQKLVHLYPDRFSWISTHITGTNMHSQFLYEIQPKNGGSRLNFEAVHVDHGKEKISPVEAQMLADSLCCEDSAVWRLLAVAMAKELKS